MDDMVTVIPSIDDESRTVANIVEDELYSDKPALTRQPLHQPPIVMIPEDGTIFVGQRIDTVVGWYVMARLYTAGADHMLETHKRPSYWIQPHNTYMTPQQKLAYINIFVTQAERRNTFAIHYYSSLIETTIEFGLAGWPMGIMAEAMRRRQHKADDPQKAWALRTAVACITEIRKREQRNSSDSHQSAVHQVAMDELTNALQDFKCGRPNREAETPQRPKKRRKT
jgi:hypothetical protein